MSDWSSDVCSSDLLSVEEDFDLYLRCGGFPAIVQSRRDSRFVNLYFQVLESDMIYKDVVPRYGIRDTSTLLRLVRTLASSIGSAASPTKIVNTLASAGREVSRKTIISYLLALTDCYLFFEAQRFDVRGRELLRTQAKYYLSDPGFRGWFVDAKTPDLGHLLENVVFLELTRRFESVTVGKNADAEVDFVARRGDRLVYVQVAWSVADPQTLERELKAFSGIKDAHLRYLLTMDVIGRNRSLAGVLQLNVLDWLLGRTQAETF